MKMLDPYTWPVVGDRLCRSRRREGRFMGFRLLGKGYSPDELQRHANKCISISDSQGRTGDVHESIGMAQAAMQWKREMDQ